MRVYMEKNKSILALFVFAIFLFSCEGEFERKEEGIIEYELTYLDNSDDIPIINFLPNSMKFMFKEDKCVQKVEGWGGIFKMIGISDAKKDSATALLKIVGQKLQCSSSLDEEGFGYKPLKDIKIEYVPGEKKIAGYNCKKAIAHSEGKTFELYYTEDLNIKKANWNTPFKEVRGVLMEYNIKMFEINVLIKAKSVERIEINDNEFDIPTGYKKMPKDSLVSSIYKYL